MKFPVSVSRFAIFGFLRMFVFATLAVVPHFAHAIYNARAADLSASAQSLRFELRGGAFQCSAVVVDAHLILAAGHCAEGVTKQSVIAKIANDADGHSLDVTVVKWARAPGYAHFDEDQQISLSQIRNEIAYFVTSENLFEVLQISPGARPLLPSADASMANLLRSQVANPMTYGYGNRGARSQGKAELRVNVQYVEADNYFRVFSLEQGVRLCRGDSGAGLMMRIKGADRPVLAALAAGITYSCDVVQSEAAFSPIAPHLCWIQRDSGVSLAGTMLDGGASCR